MSARSTLLLLTVICISGASGAARAQVSQQRASEAAQAYCRGITEKNAYAACYHDAITRLQASNTGIARPQVNYCDPTMWLRRVEQVAPPGTDPGAKMIAVEQTRRGSLLVDPMRTLRLGPLWVRLAAHGDIR